MPVADAESLVGNLLLASLIVDKHFDLVAKLFIGGDGRGAVLVKASDRRESGNALVLERENATIIHCIVLVAACRAALILRLASYGATELRRSSCCA